MGFHGFLIFGLSDFRTFFGLFSDFWTVGWLSGGVDFNILDELWPSEGVDFRILELYPNKLWSSGCNSNVWFRNGAEWFWNKFPDIWVYAHGNASSKCSWKKVYPGPHACTYTQMAAGEHSVSTKLTCKVLVPPSWNICSPQTELASLSVLKISSSS